MRSRMAVAGLAALLLATCCYAASVHDPDMTWWELLWYQGENTAFVTRWWHGIGWPAVVIGLPAAAFGGLLMFGLSRVTRRLLSTRTSRPSQELDASEQSRSGDLDSTGG
jgi:hypothetical protein